MRALDDIVRQGKARYVGVSNFRPRPARSLHEAAADRCRAVRLEHVRPPDAAGDLPVVHRAGRRRDGLWLAGLRHAQRRVPCRHAVRRDRLALEARRPRRAQPVPHHVRSRPFRAQPARGGGAQGACREIRQDLAAIRAALDAQQQRDPHWPRRLPPSGRGGGKSRRARLLDLAGRHGRDRRDLRPQRRRHRTARLAGG